MELHEKISFILSNYNITKYEFAKRLGYNKPDILYRVMNGEAKNPSSDLFQK